MRMDSAAPAVENADRFFEDDMKDLASQDSFVREQAVVRMAQRGFGVVQALISVLGDLGKPGLAATAKVLGRIRDRRAIPALTVAARMGDEELRTAAVWALGQYHEPEVLSTFVAEIGRQHTSVQAYMANTLGLFHDNQAVPVLGKLAHHPNREVAFQAACALGEIGDVRAVNSLRKARRHPDGLVRAAAVSSLRRLGASSLPFSARWVHMTVGLMVLAMAVGLAWHFYK